VSVHFATQSDKSLTAELFDRQSLLMADVRLAMRVMVPALPSKRSAEPGRHMHIIVKRATAAVRNEAAARA
jgi:hypothetical protein